MAEKIYSMYGEISADTSKLKKGLTDAQSDLKKSAKSFSDLSSMALKSFGAITGGLVLVKKAFDFAKEGAQLEYVRGKFDRLSATVGTTGDEMLASLRKVTRGMVSDSQLIASAGDFMSLGLAKTSDQVVRLTRVAGALNMDMNQLVLTLANKTTMRFDQLGVAVDGFDERLKKLKDSGLDVNAAFTEAFLQQAEAQVTKVGEVADTTAGSFARLEASAANIADEFKVKFVPIMADAADALSLLMTWEKQVNLALDQQNKRLIETSGSYDDYLAGIREALWAAGKTADNVIILTAAEWEASKAINFADVRLQDQTDSMNANDSAIRQSKVDLEGYTQAVYQSSDVGAGFKQVVDESQRAMRKAGQTAKEEKPHLEGFLGSMDRQIASPIADFIKDLEWFQAGGWRINAAFEALKRGLEEGSITPEEAEEWAGELLTVTKDIEVELDETTLKEAAKSLNENLGTPIKEAKNYIKGTDDIAGALAELVNTEYVIDVRVNYIADLPPGVEPPPVPKPKPKRQRAAGGPVISGAAYLVGERGPEMFVPSSNGNIVPNSQLGGGGNVVFGDIIINALPGMDAQAVADFTAISIDRRVRSSLRSGATYAGY